MAIDLNTLFTSLGIVSGNTQSKDQYEFYNGIVWDDATITYNQKEFFDKVGLSRYDFFKQYGDERSFYDNVDDTRITNFRTFYQYAGEYLAGADPQIPATAAFSANATQSTANTVITFTNTSTGTSPITYAWDFGDGATSSSTNPTHSYSATGSYTITLTASNAFGTDDEVKTGYIQIGDFVVASFSSSTYSTTPDTVITFTDTSTGNPTSWAWDFGDGNIDVTQNPTHSYSATGSYVVTMTASSVYDTDSTSDVITVEEEPAQVYTLDTTARGTADFLWPKGVPFGSIYHRPYMRYAIQVEASTLIGAGITNRDVSTFRVTSNLNEEISYNTYNVYMKNGTYVSGGQDTLIDTTGATLVKSLSSGSFNNWTAGSSGYYYEDLTLDTNFTWNGTDNLCVIIDMYVPNPSYASAEGSNWIAFSSNSSLMIMALQNSNTAIPADTTALLTTSWHPMVSFAFV